MELHGQSHLLRQTFAYAQYSENAKPDCSWKAAADERAVAAAVVAVSRWQQALSFVCIFSSKCGRLLSTTDTCRGTEADSAGALNKEYGEALT